jgi:flavin reductase (DIM6/NTAB) family NADH-FMN oxidoreductase RutF
MGRFASGITIMSTLQGGVAHAMTANAFTSVSLDPPLVLVCVDKGVRMHDAVLECGFWAVSVLADSHQPIAERFAKSGRDLHSQFDGIATTPGPKTVARWSRERSPGWSAAPGPATRVVTTRSWSARS